MQDPIIRVFKMEVRTQCGFALTAYDQLQHTMKQLNPLGVFYSIQALLVAVGNLSKLLFGDSSEAERDRAPIRNALSIDEQSPLRSRRMRNHFEHFDNRLEEWAKKSKRHNFADMNIMTSHGIVGLETMDYLRNFDPEEFAVTFQDETFELLPVIEAVQSVLAHMNLSERLP